MTNITKQEAQDALWKVKGLLRGFGEESIDTLQRVVNHNFTNELTHHRMDYEAIKKADWESAGELLSAYNYLLKKYNNLMMAHHELVIDYLEKG
jgi:hypothetical protein